MAELISVIAAHCQEKSFAKLVERLAKNIFFYSETELDQAKKGLMTNFRNRTAIAVELFKYRNNAVKLTETDKKALDAIEWLVTYTGPTATVWVTCFCGLRAGYTPAAGHESCNDCGMVLPELTGHRQFNCFPTAEQSGIQVKTQVDKKRPGKMPAKKLDNFQDEQDGERWDGLS